MADAILKIGPLALSSPVILAPMCGVCDFPYLRILRRFDQSSLAFHEMFSAIGLLNWHRRKEPRDLTIPSDLKPIGLQLFGHEPAEMAEAARRLVELGAAVVDVNLGCPVPRITSGCDGSALLKETALLERILRAMVAALGPTPLTIKMRLGYDDSQQNYVEVAKLAEQAGVAAITVHGRTRSQMYSGRADWEKIAEVARAVRLPVIGNGDVADPMTALARMRDHGVAGVMIGRGAQGNPWLFSRIAEYARTDVLPPEPSVRDRLAVALDHAAGIVAEMGERHGLAESKRHATWYTRGLFGGAELRGAVNAAKSYAELVSILQEAQETGSSEQELFKS